MIVPSSDIKRFLAAFIWPVSTSSGKGNDRGDRLHGSLLWSLSWHDLHQPGFLVAPFVVGLKRHFQFAFHLRLRKG